MMSLAQCPPKKVNHVYEQEVLFLVAIESRFPFVRCLQNCLGFIFSLNCIVRDNAV